ncbi:hypothetical protein RHSIM_Rhsim02G0105400 [Rhododendron simsii]|uniref:Uncharacterized protein n=1 Tax=Rhododendron simsii TaxID=118357 RepID=A0A834HNK1_RHOSS|nr:hypothetical protein RHSIM_Rhsim02G0105400 [Rhododendron simsii]
MDRRTSSRRAGMDRRTSSCRAASGKATKARRGQLYHPYQVAKVLKDPASCSSCLIRQNKEEIVSSRTTGDSTRLNFDAWAITRKIQFPALARETELYHARLDRAKYVSRVNEVLESHRGESVEEIKISFGLDGSHSRTIDNWVNFAFEKGVKRFELGLHCPLIKGPCLPYDFPRLDKFLGSDT